MFSTQLAKRAAENNPIRVGIIGAGKFGAGLVAQISQMQGYGGERNRRYRLGARERRV